MIITILAEPRSGSTNLANWFCLKENFTVFFEPMTSFEEKGYQGTTPPSEYEYNTPHLLVKEIYGNGLMLKELLEISDKVILLYREGAGEQVDSWLNAKATNNWHSSLTFNNVKHKREEVSFLKLKQKFKKEYFNRGYFEISYEDLYYRGHFQKILDYLDIEELENINFPYGNKYRTIKTPPKILKLI
jgi:hypothetical protein